MECIWVKLLISQYFQENKPRSHCILVLECTHGRISSVPWLMMYHSFWKLKFLSSPVTNLVNLKHWMMYFFNYLLTLSWVTRSWFKNSSFPTMVCHRYPCSHWKCNQGPDVNWVKPCYNEFTVCRDDWCVGQVCDLCKAVALFLCQR